MTGALLCSDLKTPFLYQYPGYIKRYMLHELAFCFCKQYIYICILFPSPNKSLRFAAAWQNAYPASGGMRAPSGARAASCLTLAIVGQDGFLGPKATLRHSSSKAKRGPTPRKGLSLVEPWVA